MVERIITPGEELALRPVLKGITVDDGKILHPEQAFGLAGERIHYSIADMGYLLDNLGINPHSLVIRAIDIGTKGRYVPRGQFEFVCDKTRPAISMLVSSNSYEFVASQVEVNAAFVCREVKNVISDGGEFSVVLQKAADEAYKLQNAFVTEGISPLTKEKESAKDGRFAGAISMRLSSYSAILVAKYFKEHNLPAVYNVYNAEKNKKTGYLFRFEETPEKSYVAVKWSSPARNVHHLINGLQLSAHLRGRKLPFGKEDIEEFMSLIKYKVAQNGNNI